MKTRTSLPLLTAIFGTLLALDIFTSACVFLKTIELHQKIAQAEARYHRASSLLIEARSDIYSSMFRAQQYLLAPGSEARQRASSELSNLKLAFDQRLRELKPQLADGPEMERLSAEFANFWALVQKTFDPANERESISARLSEGTAALGHALHATQEMDAINGTSFQEEQRELEQDNHAFARFLLWITALNVVLGLVVSFASLKRLRHLQQESEAERQKTERAELDLRHLSQQLVKAQEEERKNISRELHDEVGQLLTGLRIELGNLQRSQDKAILEDRIGEAKELTERALRTIRNMAMLLRPSMLDDQGLAPALRWQAREYSRRFETPVTVEIEGETDRVPSGHAVCLYRVIQEVLTNCARHAQAKQIRIAVQANESLLAATVDDDGVGFRSQPRPNGIGLLGIAERVRELRGTFLIDSEPDRGTRVNVRLPIPKA